MFLGCEALLTVCSPTLIVVATISILCWLENSSQRGIECETFTAFFLIHAVLGFVHIAVNCCRQLLLSDKILGGGVGLNPTPIYKSEIIFTLPSEDFYIEMKGVEAGEGHKESFETAKQHNCFAIQSVLYYT